MNSASRSAWRSWTEVYLRGESRFGARTPRVAGVQGGRAVGVPVSATDRPMAAAHVRIEAERQDRPWQGPIDKDVYRLRSSIESNPSVTAALISLSVTSM